MKSCRDVEPLMAPYVDGDAAPGDRAAVEAHSKRAAAAATIVGAQRPARDVLRARRDELREPAPPQLRARCAAHAASGARAAHRVRLSGPA